MESVESYIKKIRPESIINVYSPTFYRHNQIKTCLLLLVYR